jgi:hypothetical protein
MKQLLLAFVALLSPQGQDPEPVVYTNHELGLTFTHPASWEFNQDRHGTRVQIPLEGTPERAQLEIFSATFHSEPDIWQAAERNMVEQMRRQVVRQWQEVLLNVPLLLTQSQFEQGGIPRTTVTGLVYSRTPRKLLFRLTANTADFEKADQEWRNVLQSLRTTDGRVPEPEDWTRKPTEAEILMQPTGRPPRSTTMTKEETRPEVQKAPESVRTTVGGSDVVLRYPTGWTVEQTEEGWRFSHAQLSRPALITVHSELDSEFAGRALLRSSGRTLNLFTKVDGREENSPPSYNRGGSIIVWIWRYGAAGGARQFSMDSIGLSEEAKAYWLLTWNSQNAQAEKQDRKLLDGLINAMSVDPAP